ncbi:MAG: potassium-transporting ATPase subunit KdpB, partial [Thermoguttaceae bacterium]
MSRTLSNPSVFDRGLVAEAVRASFKKLDPRVQVRNPVMFAVYVASILTTVLWVDRLSSRTGESPWFVVGVAAWLWLTVLFANFAEAMAEGRGKAQAANLRKSRQDVRALRVADTEGGGGQWISSSLLSQGDLVLVRAEEVIPADGEVVHGVASVDESAVTGESAPVVRESGGDRSAVTGGTRVISDWLVIRVTAVPGESFLDRMISLVEGAKRQKTPSEIALAILLSALTLIFLLVVATLLPFSTFSVQVSGQGRPVSLTVLIALFVCLAPTTIGALLSAIGIAGMNRLSQANVIAMSGRAVEAAGDVDVLLLDKTGTITLGNRQATGFLPADGVTERELAEVAHLASMADETAEGRSIAVLAKNRFGLRGRELAQIKPHFTPFSARTRMSGVSLDGREIRKGAAEAVEAHVRSLGGIFPEDVRAASREIAASGGTPLVVSRDAEVLGAIELKDIVKGGIKERFVELRRMGIKTVMITGDNPLTA